MRNVIAWAGLLGVMTAHGFAEPARPPATQPAARLQTAAPMPEEFKPLLSRSVFVRKGARPAGVAIAVKASGSGLALRGVIRDDAGAYTAIIEDPTTHQIQRIENGATLAGGSVSHITLRGFQYDVGGKSVAVAIGQNLAGETAVVAPPAPAAQVADGVKAPAAPATGPSDAGQQPPPDAAAIIADLSAADGAPATRMRVHRMGQNSNNN